MRYQITASLVTYKSDPKILLSVIESFLSTHLNTHLYISDNSPDDRLRKEFEGNANITYIYNNANLGFGAGHNVGIRLALPCTMYHVILNPDVYFDGIVLSQLFECMDKNPQYSVMAPKVLYPDGRIQNSIRLLPNIFEQVLRRLPITNYLFKPYLDSRSLESLIKHEQPVEIPFLLGCFLFFRQEALEHIGGFDERFFMYMEDVDICRRARSWGKTIYNPQISIYHIYERGSTKSFRLLKMHIRSMIQYYNKWGWFSDIERKHINNDTLMKLRTPKEP